MTDNEKDRISKIASKIDPSQLHLENYDCKPEDIKIFLESNPYGKMLVQSRLGLEGLPPDKLQEAALNDSSNQLIENSAASGTIAVGTVAMGTIGWGSAVARNAEIATSTFSSTIPPVSVSGKTIGNGVAGGIGASIFAPIARELVEPFLHHPTTDELNMKGVSDAYQHICNEKQGTLKPTETPANPAKTETKSK